MRIASHKMAKSISTLFLFVFIGLLNQSAAAQENHLAQEVERLPWQTYPTIGAIGAIARINLSNDWEFLDATSTSRFLELNGNPPRSDNYTLASKSLGWFSIFAFDPSGYVRDDQTLDPDVLLTKLKKQNEDGIAERKRLNLPILHLVGWAVVPHYDPQTHRLEWGTKLVDDAGNPTINYTIRILGRSGVMSAILVSDPVNLNRDIQNFRSALLGFEFVPGQSYAEFHQGDRVAEYGLAALIVGGAAAVAAKTGVFTLIKILGVSILAGFAAVFSFFCNLVKNITKKKHAA